MAELLPVADALARILSDVTPLEAESVAISEAAHRTLAHPLAANRRQPPFDASAMDGYAVRASDAFAGARLRVIGMSAAGHGFKGAVGAGDAVRIFTGAPTPPGADAVVIQEDVERDDGMITVREAARAGRNIRSAGVDFERGQTLLDPGRRLDARALGLAAAMGHGAIAVRRQPRVTILATGDELVRPGVRPNTDQIVLSNSYSLAALARDAGAAAIDLGIASDDVPSLAQCFQNAREA
ncbi:MAG: molybdopterin molybdotransferase MoeA, partial [Beijerinckiaceae bacterium]